MVLGFIKQGRVEIAAGMYLYHVRPNFSDKSLNGLEHTGKFAVIKQRNYTYF